MQYAITCDHPIGSDEFNTIATEILAYAISLKLQKADDDAVVTVLQHRTDPSKRYNFCMFWKSTPQVPTPAGEIAFNGGVLFVAITHIYNIEKPNQEALNEVEKKVMGRINTSIKIMGNRV